MASEVGRGRPIVIVGGGFAGAYCAQRLERLLGAAGRRVVLIDRHNYFVFSPLLIEAGTGDLEPRHAVVSTRSFLRRCRFLMGEVLGADPLQRCIRYRPAGRDQTLVLEYEHLVLAPGSVSSLPPIDGLAEHAFPMKSLADAVALRDRAVQLLEEADAEPNAAARSALLRWVVIGASFTGVEVAGEFHAFLRRAARRYPNVDPRECQVTLVEISDRILPALDRELAQYAAQQLHRRGVELALHASVEKIGPDCVELRGGRVIECSTAVWCAGIAPAPLVGKLGLPTDERGYLICQPDLRAKGREDVWAIGDCASVPGPNGAPYPATAQHAVRQGMLAAENIVAALQRRPVRPFVYHSSGTLAPLGCRTAVAKIGRLKVSGLSAWLLWRMVYLLKMPGFARKVRVALDWSLDAIFPRDYVVLGVRRPVGVSPVPAAAPESPVAAPIAPPPPHPTPFPGPKLPPPARKATVPFSQIAAQMAEAHQEEEER